MKGRSEKCQPVLLRQYAMRSLGLYLHIPFCRSKCLYCDFCSYPRPKDADIEAYAEALCRDLERRAADCDGYTVDTVYFGGGTPTLLPTALLDRITQSLARHYHLAGDLEMSAECNPATADREKLTAMRQMGFNRLSIGLQSAHAGELRALGRLHDFDDFRTILQDARAAGFENVSADVMFGIPEQTTRSYLETLEGLCALEPTHISAYGLTVEEETPFGRMGARLRLPDEEETRRMYFEGIDLLREKRYVQYEISNFCREGFSSRHNLKYWNCEEYLGFGPAAYSDFGGSRFGNSRDLCAYINGEDIVEERETPSRRERLNEYVMLRLRLCEGIHIPTLEKRFAVDFEEAFGKRLDGFANLGLVRREGERIFLTGEGMYVSNAVLSDILDFSD